MNQKKTFYKKIIYILLIVVLLFPIYRLGSPSQIGKDGKLSKGGTLSQQRTAPNGKPEDGFSETRLGDIDPASSTMKLATFGMRGVAIAVLWNRSLEYEKKQDWNNVVATGNQIIALEPHFISVWDHVGWKLAYNASAQFDDYRERYRWVIRGFEFLQKGTKKNSNAPKLFSKAAWTISQKIGIADEKNQYRRLFREDDQFHEANNVQNYEERDNWLFGCGLYKRAEELFELGGDIGKETRILFYSRRPMNLIHYAEWMEQDGCGKTRDNSPLFDTENAVAAWRTASESWAELAKKRVKTVIEDKSHPGQFREMSLNEAPEAEEQLDAIVSELLTLVPEGMTYETLVWDRWNNELTDAQRCSLRESLEKPAPECDPEYGKPSRPLRVVRDYLDGKYGEQPDWVDWREKLEKIALDELALLPQPEDGRSLLEIYKTPQFLWSEEETNTMKGFVSNMATWNAQARALLQITPEVLADQIKDEQKHQRALELCDQVDPLLETQRFSQLYRDILDCSRHDRQVSIEQTEEAREAREHRYLARVRFYSGQQEEANDEFLACEAAWRRLFERPDYVELLWLSEFLTNFLDENEKYTIILDQLERIFPEEYPFDVVEEKRFDNKGAKSLDEKLPKLLDELFEKNDPNRLRLAMVYLGFWNIYFNESETAPLFPMKACRAGLVRAMDYLARAIESADPSQSDEVVSILENLPLREQLELYIAKGEPIYQEIQKNSLLVITDPDHAQEHQDNAVQLWSDLVQKYPILKFDTNSTYRAQIQAVAQSYADRLKNQGETLPEDFALKTFLQK